MIYSGLVETEGRRGENLPTGGDTTGEHLQWGTDKILLTGRDTVEISREAEAIVGGI